MRLKAQIFVDAYLRRCQGEGAPAVLVRRGDERSGAIFIKILRLDGTADLYGPAPAGYAEAEFERRFVAIGGRGRAEPAIDADIAAQARFDPDLWLVEVEDRSGRHFLDDWLQAG